MKISKAGITKWKVGAYFTVEAVLILPIVLGVILLIIYLWFFQYDRCLMEQDIGALALRGAALEAADNENRVRALKDYANEMYLEKYIAWNQELAAIKMQQRKITVGGKGSLNFPFKGLNFWNNENVWESAAEYKNTVLSPETVVRNYNKLVGGE